MKVGDGGQSKTFKQMGRDRHAGYKRKPVLLTLTPLEQFEYNFTTIHPEIHKYELKHTKSAASTSRIHFVVCLINTSPQIEAALRLNI